MAKTIDEHLDAILKASGSSLRYFSLQKPIDDMRSALADAVVDLARTYPHVVMDRTAVPIALTGWRFERVNEHEIRITDPAALAPIIITLDDQALVMRTLWRLAAELAAAQPAIPAPQPDDEMRADFERNISSYLSPLHLLSLERDAESGRYLDPAVFGAWWGYCNAAATIASIPAPEGAPDLRSAAQAVLDRWNSPKWEWAKQGPTADLMADLRAALAAQPQATPGVFDAPGFRAWVLANLPDQTIIGSSAWWADHLTAWAGRFVKAAPVQSPAEGDEVARLALVAIDESEGALMVCGWMEAALKVCRAVIAQPQPKDMVLIGWQYRDANDDGTWGAWLGCDKRLDPSKWRQVRGVYAAEPGSVQAPAPAPDDKALTQALEERDAASDYIDALLDEVLGKHRPEWTSNYGHADAMEEVRQRMAALQSSLDFHKRRCVALQACQSTMRDPERTMVCDILANGSLLINGQGKLAAERYAVPCAAVAPEPAPAAQPATWTPLPFKTPLELWKAFRAGAGLVLHYYGKQHPVERMEVREAVVYVQPPWAAVKVFPDGRSAEGNAPGDGIWLRLAVVNSKPPVQGSGQ